MIPFELQAAIALGIMFLAALVGTVMSMLTSRSFSVGGVLMFITGAAAVYMYSQVPIALP